MHALRPGREGKRDHAHEETEAEKHRRGNERRGRPEACKEGRKHHHLRRKPWTQFQEAHGGDQARRAREKDRIQTGGKARLPMTSAHLGYDAFGLGEDRRIQATEENQDREHRERDRREKNPA